MCVYVCVFVCLCVCSVYVRMKMCVCVCVFCVLRRSLKKGVLRGSEVFMTREVVESERDVKRCA